MTNLVNVEKSLKHWLKNKVTVTTATVVGFLIMGTVSFGAKIVITDSKEIVNDKILEETNDSKAIWIKGDKNKTNFTNSNEIKNIVKNHANGILVDSSEEVTINNMGKESSIIAQTIEGDGLSTGIKSYANKTTITNEGVISAIGDKGMTSGIVVNNTFSITNKGAISALSNSAAYGIYLYSPNTEINTSTINNTGIISTETTGGGDSSPIYINTKVKAGEKLTITNSKEAKLISKRTGVSEGLGGQAAVYINSSGEGEVLFTNNGDIQIDRGIAVELIGKNSSFTNNGTILLSNGSVAVKNNGGTATISGTVKVTDKNGNEIDLEKLFVGSTSDNTNIVNKGMIVGKDGVAIKNSNSTYLKGDLFTNDINSKGATTKSVTLGSEARTGQEAQRIVGINKDAINLDALNIVGEVITIDVKVENTTINIDKAGKFVVDNSTLSIDNGNVNKDAKTETAVELIAGSTLNLKDVNFNGGISSDDNENKLNISGNTYIDGKIGVKNITVGANGKAVGSDKLTLASTSKFTKDTTLTNNTTGTTVFQIDKDGNNALSNSDKKVTVLGKIDFDTSELTKDNYGIELNNGSIYHNLEKTEYNDVKDQVYNITLDRKGNKLTLEYNKNLFTNTALNSINNIAQIVNGNFSQDVAERESQLDKIYTQNIYTETVKAFYDTLKSTEHEVLSLNHGTKAGELKADGKALYSKNEYTKDGVAGSYDVKAETSGLLAALEYGVTDTMRTGVVFAGSKQDLDTIGGKADADIFYLGVYGNRTYGNYDFTAGLGYQFGKYEADNNIGNVATSDKYDTNAFTGYVQGKYTFNFEDGVSIQPKAKLGYTYLKQDDAKDAYFGVSDAEITTYDTEVGVDVVKSVQFEKSKLDVTFGASYVRTMGDTDEMFKGHFYGDNTTTHFNVLGAELDENVIKFNLGAEVGHENGFFYNGGFTYEFGGNDTKAYGVNAGVGYKF